MNSQANKHLFTLIAIDSLASFKSQATEAKQHEYMQKVSSLLYTTIITCPDTTKTANRLAEFATNPGPDHIKAVNYAISYLFYTHHYVLEYSAPSRNSKEVFICTSNTAYSDLIGWKSSKGYLCKLFGTTID